MRNFYPDDFRDDEYLVRAVRMSQIQGNRPRPKAFIDERGLSVERTYNQSRYFVAQDMARRFEGNMYAVTVRDCNDVDAEVIYAPSKNSLRHSEIHGSKTEVELTIVQARHLANMAECVYAVGCIYE